MADRIEGYAAAIYELAHAEGRLAVVERELYSVARALEASQELRDALVDPNLPFDRKSAILHDLLGGRAGDMTINVLNLIIGLGRISELSEIVERLGARAAEKSGTAIAEVRSAVELDEETIERLAAALAKTVGRPVEIRVVVDSTVLGGLVARVGDIVIDGTVAHRLETLRSVAAGRN